MNDKNERTESELIGELRAAHQIIRNALNLMTADQKRVWAIVNKRDGVIGEGTTRANERQAVIDKATTDAGEQPLTEPLANAQALASIDLIIRDVCESDPADPDADDSVCIGVDDLRGIIEKHLAANAHAATTTGSAPVAWRIGVQNGGDSWVTESEGHACVARRLGDIVEPLGVISDAAPASPAASVLTDEQKAAIGRIEYFLKTWEYSGVGSTIKSVQDSPDTRVSIDVTDLRALLASMCGD